MAGNLPATPTCKAPADKGKQVVIIFTVPNIKEQTVKVQLKDDMGDGEEASAANSKIVSVAFDTFSPTKRWEKVFTLLEPVCLHGVSKNVTAKNMTLTLTKAAHAPLTTPPSPPTAAPPLALSALASEIGLSGCLRHSVDSDPMIDEVRLERGDTLVEDEAGEDDEDDDEPEVAGGTGKRKQKKKKKKGKGGADSVQSGVGDSTSQSYSVAQPAAAISAQDASRDRRQRTGASVRETEMELAEARAAIEGALADLRACQEAETATHRLKTADAKIKQLRALLKEAEAEHQAARTMFDAIGAARWADMDARVDLERQIADRRTALAAAEARHAERVDIVRREREREEREAEERAERQAVEERQRQQEEKRKRNEEERLRALEEKRQKESQRKENARKREEERKAKEAQEEEERKKRLAQKAAGGSSTSKVPISSPNKASAEAGIGKSALANTNGHIGRSTKHEIPGLDPPRAAAPATPWEGPIIEELPDEVVPRRPERGSTDAKGSDSGWRFEVGGDGAPPTWVLELHVPSIESLSQVALDISPTMVMLIPLEGGAPVAQSPVPSDADDATASAKWSKKKQTLTLKMQPRSK